MYKHLIDIHSHVLPQMDNGARNIQQSIDIIKACHAEGISTIIATPHYHQKQAKGILVQRMDAWNELQEAMQPFNLSVQIYEGFEVSADITLLDRTSLGALTLAGTRWILLERPYLYAEEFDDVMEAVFECNLLPVIAHPERYPYFTDDFDALQDWVSRGAYIQLSADAVAGNQGKQLQQWCMRALEIRLAHFVASNIHNASRRAPCMQAAANAIAAILGERKMIEIMYHNPERLLGLRT